MSETNSKYKEWIKQSDYDIGTAEAMFSTGRYIYSVFMCHLAIEKALKAFYHRDKNEVPPKTHNLILLLDRTDLKPSEETEKFIIKLNTANITTRYPENLDKIQNIFNKTITEEIISQTKEVLSWIKKL